MQHRAHILLGGNGVDPIQVTQQGGPPLLVQGGAGVIAGEAAVGGEHQRARAGGRIPLEYLDHIPQRVVIGAVEQQRGEPTDRMQLVPGQHVGHRFRLGGKEALGSELGGHQADLAHLGEDTIRRKLVAPAGHLTDAPGNRRTSDLVRGCAHRYLPPRRGPVGGPAPWTNLAGSGAAVLKQAMTHHRWSAGLRRHTTDQASFARSDCSVSSGTRAST